MALQEADVIVALGLQRTDGKKNRLFLAPQREHTVDARHV